MADATTDTSNTRLASFASLCLLVADAIEDEPYVERARHLLVPATPRPEQRAQALAWLMRSAPSGPPSERAGAGGHVLDLYDALLARFAPKSA